jgi:hypothetical protein
MGVRGLKRILKTAQDIPILARHARELNAIPAQQSLRCDDLTNSGSSLAALTMQLPI